MVKVKKRKGTTEEFLESKIIAGCKRAGATAEEAAKVAKEATIKAAKMAVVDAEKLSDIVVESLKKSTRLLERRSTNLEKKSMRSAEISRIR